jgi:hypothetical protein
MITKPPDHTGPPPKFHGTRDNLVLTTIPGAIVLGWMVRASNRPGAGSYVAFGALMLAAWTTSMLRVGWSLAGEIYSGTFEPALLSRTPIFVVMAAKDSRG